MQQRGSFTRVIVSFKQFSDASSFKLLGIAAAAQQLSIKRWNIQWQERKKDAKIEKYVFFFHFASHYGENLQIDIRKCILLWYSLSLSVTLSIARKIKQLTHSHDNNGPKKQKWKEKKNNYSSCCFWAMFFVLLFLLFSFLRILARNFCHLFAFLTLSLWLCFRSISFQFYSLNKL